MWIKVKFKEGRVWALCDESGQLLTERGRVPIRYQLAAGAKIYQAAAANISELAGAAPEESADPPAGAAPATFGKAGQRSGSQAEKAALHAKNLLSLLPDDTIICFTDGASRGNPGAAAAAFMIKWPADMDKKSIKDGRFLGENTNNFAELTAVKMALTCLKGAKIPAGQNIAILTDSKYVHGLFTSSWQAKANSELVSEIKMLLKNWPKARFHWVPGHAGVEGNEIVDALANEMLDKAAAASAT